MSAIRREFVTIVRQTVLDDKVVSAQTCRVKRNVYRDKEGVEYVEVDCERVPLIRGVALTGGRSDPKAKTTYK